MKIRHSSYIPGLLLGLIDDSYIPGWEDKFMDMELFLSDFIQKELDIKIEEGFELTGFDPMNIIKRDS